LGIWESLEKIPSLKQTTSSRKTLQWLIVGYLSFMASMGTTYTLVPATRNAVASIMCGFALAMPFILTFKWCRHRNAFHGCDVTVSVTRGIFLDGLTVLNREHPIFCRIVNS